MATSAKVHDLRTERPARLAEERASFPSLLPGIALLFVVGYAGKFVEHFLNTYTKAHHITFPNIEYVLWAIVFGVVIANTVGVTRIFRPGVATYEFWLKAGIILLGARFILGDVLKLGGISLILVFVAITLSITFMTWLGRRFGLNPALTTLLAVGSSICGVSAIIATQGAIDADEDDSATAIAAILALGAISLFTFPLIGHTLHMSDRAYGLWAGLAVDNTAEATAAGALFSDAAGKYAVLAKTCRNALIGFVVLAYAIQWARKGLANTATTTQLENKAAFLWKKFPKFVLGFLFISLLATLGSSTNPFVASLGFSKPQLLALGNLSRWAFLLTFAGVGLRTNLKDLFRQGARPFLVGAVGETVIAAITLALVLGVDHFYHL
ncbi:putative integral membrane protein (TIGR00698 family) [Edaphobacter aggregans]|uniref:Putative integral membrane protein (TIGR00698 family) n=1 Tax=Edaphobacter aggregans TaxID=570835 RepID=A0A3R9Q9C0_9BACT|nr:putative sulfate exporter family transporter [Edaphobacter aggregans]RSL16384.1 putative integral membrane protein (TIGR00698 family) [Edaphobacter aggregans]